MSIYFTIQLLIFFRQGYKVTWISAFQPNFFFPVILLCLASVFPADAQTKPKPKPYNHATPTNSAPDLRRVDGKLYDASKSVLWSQIKAECLYMTTNGPVLSMVTYKRKYENEPLNDLQRIGALGPVGPPTKRLVSEEKVLGERFLLRNYPAIPKGKVVQVRAMRIGMGEVQGEKIAVWDCGVVAK